MLRIQKSSPFSKVIECLQSYPLQVEELIDKTKIRMRRSYVNKHLIMNFLFCITRLCDEYLDTSIFENNFALFVYKSSETILNVSFKIEWSLSSLIEET